MHSRSKVKNQTSSSFSELTPDLSKLILSLLCQISFDNDDVSDCADGFTSGSAEVDFYNLKAEMEQRLSSTGCDKNI